MTRKASPQDMVRKAATSHVRWLRIKADPAFKAKKAASDHAYYLRHQSEKIIRERERRALAPAPWWHRFKGGEPIPGAAALPHVMRAVGVLRLRHVRDDAASEMLLALMEGRVALVELDRAVQIWLRQTKQPSPWLELPGDNTLVALTLASY